MASKKQTQNQQQMPQQDDALLEQIDAQAQQQAVNEHLATMEEGLAIQNQEEINKSHDTEMSDYATNTTGEAVGTLGVIDKDEVRKAYELLLKYKEEKSSLEEKISENEQFWKMNHWDVMVKGGQEADDKRIRPRSGWLFNTIINKHADAMDNFPEANILPRSSDDEKVAEALSQIIPVVLEQNDYEETYSDAQWYKAKNGTSVQGVFWNNDKNNGLGDIEIKKIDLLNIFWKGGIADIQDSPSLFHVTMMANDEIKERYPDVNVGSANSLGLTTVETYHEGVDTSNQTAVIDWYYKKRVRVTDDLGIPKTKTILHYCKFCNDTVIYASENDPNYAERGWYDHGKYPFVFDSLFPVEGSVCGIGYIDITKDDQLYIDKLQQAILESAVTNARPRYFVREDGGLNESEFLDLSKPIVHMQGNLGEDAMRVIENSPFDDVYVTVLLNKIQEVKDTSGNTASSQGQTSSVTSASGIASLQEAAGKLSRDANSGSYRAYKLVVDLVIELIRQFYNEPRCFRITGDTGENQFITFDNTQLLPQQQGEAFGVQLGSRLPIMDIDVRPQKKSAYSKETQNQTAINLYSMGFFAPTNADASLAALNMMDFDGIEKVREFVQQNGTLMQMVLQMQQQLMAYQNQLQQLGAIVDAQNGTNLVGDMQGETAETDASVAQIAQSGNAGSSGTTQNNSKGSLSTQAASATRGSTAPR